MQILRLAALLAVIGVAHATITISWKDCGTAATHAKITNVTYSPQPVQPGDKVTIIGYGTVNKPTTKLTATITFAGVIKHTFDACAGATIEAPLNIAKIVFPPAGCPILIGSFNTTRYVYLASKVPSGDTTSELTAVDQDGQPFTCVEITLSNKN